MLFRLLFAYSIVAQSGWDVNRGLGSFLHFLVFDFLGFGRLGSTWSFKRV